MAKPPPTQIVGSHRPSYSTIAARANKRDDLVLTERITSIINKVLEERLNALIETIVNTISDSLATTLISASPVMHKAPQRLIENIKSKISAKITPTNENLSHIARCLTSSRANEPHSNNGITSTHQQ